MVLRESKVALLKPAVPSPLDLHRSRNMTALTLAYNGETRKPETTDRAKTKRRGFQGLAAAD